MTGDHAARQQTGRKAVLFCRVCGHNAPLDAGWDEKDAHHERTEIACSKCGHVVVTQPTFNDADGEGTFFTSLANLINTVAASGLSTMGFTGRFS